MLLILYAELKVILCFLAICFKKKFGKQVCTFCGQEVGMMNRDKIKNDEFICHDCRRTCSRYIQVYRYTKDQLLDHMEYMKRQGKLLESISALKGYRLPDGSSLLDRILDSLDVFVGFAVKSSSTSDHSKENKNPYSIRN